MPDITIKKATITDSSQILKFITELATYEKAKHEVVAKKADIETSLFGKDSIAKAIICEMDDNPVGFAVYFYSYSTWLAGNCLYLEDLYVTPGSRGTGAGKALLKYLAQLAVNKGCQRFEWSVLGWNKTAIEFYESIGAVPQHEWTKYRLSDTALKRAAE